jgi:hypothetical protein
MFAEKMSYGLNDDVGSSVRSSAGSASAAWPWVIVGLTSRTRAKLPKRDRIGVLDVVGCGIIFIGSGQVSSTCVAV